MKQDFEMNFIGKGEEATFIILKHLTGLPLRSLKHFPFSNGIYRQVPLSWIITPEDFNFLSKAHQKGSIDLYIKLEQIHIAVRVQGEGHGSGLKGIGKSKHDKVQADLIKKYCSLVDITKNECKEIFKEKTNNKAINEIIDAFRTNHVLIPSVTRN